MDFEGGTPQQPGAVTPEQAGNLVRNLEAPRYGVNRYIESRLAEGAGTRELKGGGRKGFVYTAGPYKGLTEGQAKERARQEYASLKPGARAAYERGAQGLDVMSPGEQARTKQHYTARGLRAAGDMAGGSVTLVRPTRPHSPMAGGSVTLVRPTRPHSPQSPAPQPSPTPQTQSPSPQSRPTTAPRSLGTINGVPVEDIRARNESERLARVGAERRERLAPVNGPRDRSGSGRRIQQWRDDYRARTGEEPRSAEEQAAWREAAQESVDRASRLPVEPSPSGGLSPAGLTSNTLETGGLRTGSVQGASGLQTGSVQGASGLKTGSVQGASGLKTGGLQTGSVQGASGLQTGSVQGASGLQTGSVQGASGLQTGSVQGASGLQTGSVQGASGLQTGGLQTGSVQGARDRSGSGTRLAAAAANAQSQARRSGSGERIASAPTPVMSNTSQALGLGPRGIQDAAQAAVRPLVQARDAVAGGVNATKALQKGFVDGGVNAVVGSVEGIKTAVSNKWDETKSNANAAFQGAARLGRAIERDLVPPPAASPSPATDPKRKKVKPVLTAR